jgi:hypothetical protein
MFWGEINMELTRYKKKTFPVDTRFAGYAIAVGAALAGAKGANAGIVETVLPEPINYLSGNHSLDLNGNGSTDFDFSALSTSFLLIDGQSSGDLILSNDDGLASILGVGYTIGATSPWPTGPVAEISSFGTQTTYLALRIGDASGNKYYGFAEFSPTFNLEGYAYNSTAGASITTFDLTATPEPGELSLMALGAASLAILRRKRRHS